MLYHIKNKYLAAKPKDGLQSQPKITMLIDGQGGAGWYAHQYVANQCGREWGLKEFIRYLKPEYIMPSTATVTKSIEKQFEEKKDELKVKLSKRSE